MPDVLSSNCRTSFLFFFLMCLLPFKVYGQQHSNPGGYWLAYVGESKIKARFGIHSEAQIRNLGVTNKAMQTVLIRGGVHYYSNSNSLVSLGFGYFINEPTEPGTYFPRSRETQVWEQFVSRKKTSWVLMEHRYRLEHRFILDLDKGASALSHRIRYRFQVLLPLKKVNPGLPPLFIASFNETFLNFSSNTDAVFDRTRFYGAIGYQASQNLSYQLGYVYQFAAQPAYLSGSISHIAQFLVSYTIDNLTSQSAFSPQSKE